MLTLENETNYKDVVVNIDEFVPFDITFGKGANSVCTGEAAMVKFFG